MCANCRKRSVQWASHCCYSKLDRLERIWNVECCFLCDNHILHSFLAKVKDSYADKENASVSGDLDFVGACLLYQFEKVKEFINKCKYYCAAKVFYYEDKSKSTFCANALALLAIEHRYTDCDHEKILQMSQLLLENGCEPDSPHFTISTYCEFDWRGYNTKLTALQIAFRTESFWTNVHSEEENFCDSENFKEVAKLVEVYLRHGAKIDVPLRNWARKIVGYWKASPCKKMMDAAGLDLLMEEWIGGRRHQCKEIELQAQARDVIRKQLYLSTSVGNLFTRVDKLPLPNRIKNFLLHM